MRTEDFDYVLPAERIAAYPAERRDASRLLRLDRATGETENLHFYDLPGLLREGDCLVLNDSRVIPARLLGKRAGGGRAEVFLLAPEGNGNWRALLRPARKLPRGSRIELGEAEAAVLVEENFEGGEARVRFEGSEPVERILEQFGEVPLPPYILAARKAAPVEDGAKADRERYQTVYAHEAGSVAAPTAGLHFTPELLGDIERKGVEIRRVTLHVGSGTFAPVHEEDPRDHPMHSERYGIGEEDAGAISRAIADPGRRVIAVGTTVTRVLEASMSRFGEVRPGAGETNLLILPGHAFWAVDGLITNFHLPRSTLLMLVSAFAGRERVLAAYEEAVESGYRFYSYGDAMFVG